MEWLIWSLYWVQVLSSVHMAALGIAICVGMLWTALTIGLIINTDALYDDEVSLWERMRKNLTIVLVVATILAVFTPSQETLNRMLAVKAVDVVAQTKEAQKIIPKAAQVVEQYLDSVLQSTAHDSK